MPHLSTAHPKSPPASRLPLLPVTLLLRPRPAQDLQEIRRPPPHPAVDVGFAGFDVVVEVVPEGLDVRDYFGASRGLEVAGEENEGDVANFSLAGFEVWLTLEF